MAGSLNLNTTALHIPASDDRSVTIANGGPGTVYYGDKNVSSSSSDGSISSGASLLIRQPYWIVSASSSKVQVIEQDPNEDTTNRHGITDFSALATGADITAHSAVTTSVHGIADTADLPTKSGDEVITGAWGLEKASVVGVTNVKGEGASGDGTTDDTLAIQAALDAGGDVVVPPGNYRCTASLTFSSDTSVQLLPGARLVKDFATTSGTLGAFIRNEDFGTKANNVHIFGGGEIGAASHDETGKIVTLYGDDMRIEDITVRTFSGGQAFVLAGDRVRLRGVKVFDSPAVAGTGGIRFVGGDDFIAESCHVECGDDCIQFAPVATSTDPLFDLDISRGAYVGCTGESTNARFMVAILIDNTGAGPMASSIRNCSFVACHGKSSNRGIVVENEDSSGDIDGVTFTDCSIDEDGASTSTQSIDVERAAAGRVRGIHFYGLRVRNPIGQVFSGQSTNDLEDIVFENCEFDAPDSAPAIFFDLSSVTGAIVRGNVFRGWGTTASLSVGGSGASSDVTIENCRFEGIPNAANGINLVSVTWGSVLGCTYREAAGATTARAIRIGAASSRVRVAGNDVSRLTWAATNRIVDLGATDVMLGHNPGYATDKLTSAASLPAALTAADASTVDGTYGAEEQAVIENLRTRLDELEGKLQALGLLA